MGLLKTMSPRQRAEDVAMAAIVREVLTGVVTGG